MWASSFFVLNCLIKSEKTTTNWELQSRVFGVSKSESFFNQNFVENASAKDVEQWVNSG